MGGAAISGELFLEFGDFRAEDILAVGEDPGDAALDLGAEPLLLGGEIDERHHADGSVRVTRSPANR